MGPFRLSLSEYTDVELREDGTMRFFMRGSSIIAQTALTPEEVLALVQHFQLNGDEITAYIEQQIKRDEEE